MVSKDLDERDRWLGLKMLRKGYQPIPNKLRDERGQTYSTRNKAEEAAEFLASRIWGQERPANMPNVGTSRIINQEIGINTEPIKLWEIKATI